MRHVLDTSRVRYLVTTEAKEKRDQNGAQKIDRKTGELLFQFQVMALDETGGEMLTVTVAGILPKVTVGQYVHLVEREALPWATNGRSGIAYRATDVQPADQSKATLRSAPAAANQ